MITTHSGRFLVQTSIGWKTPKYSCVRRSAPSIKALSTKSKLLCLLADGSAPPSGCSVRIVGQLGDYKKFTMYVTKNTHSVAVMTDQSQQRKSSRAWKIVIAVIVVIIILAALGAIIWLARKKMKSPKEVVDMGSTNYPLGNAFRFERHFGIVSRATYTAPDGTTKKVACKILKQKVEGVGDFILEGVDEYDVEPKA
ncbi:hypothetical protein COOONC_09196 [Cooperia oncophora]